MPSRPRRPPEDLGRAVAAILRDEADDQWITQTALAEMVGLSQTQVSDYLRAAKGMTLDEAHAICKALGLTLSDVIREGEE